MNKKLRELIQALEKEKGNVRALLSEDKIKEAETAMEEVRALQKEVSLQKELDLLEDESHLAGTLVKAVSGEDLETKYKKVFLKGLRMQRISSDDRSIIREYRSAVMHEGGAIEQDSGKTDLIVPKDIETHINELMRTMNDLSQYIRLETVNTLSGSRVLEKDEDMTPFAEVSEYGTIGITDNPKFQEITYELKKRAGYLPLTSELLSDTDQNILGYVSNWIAKKHVVTKNLLITTILDGMDKMPLSNLKDIKKVINVDLDPALITSGGILLTNQDGYNWLDGEVDGQGRFLLQDDITQPGRKLFKGLPVAVIGNRYLPSDTEAGTKAPVIIGNLKELIVLFTRGKYELSSTREGGDAWRRDTTELRTITRDDCRMWDEDAAIFGELTIQNSK